MKKQIYLLVVLFINSLCVFSQSYPNNEDGIYEDMLTPRYYQSDQDGFRTEVNRFIYFARQIPFQHPLSNSIGQKPEFRTSRGFGDGIGPGGTGSHHPATDYYINNNSTEVKLYAAHDGFVRISRDVARYRHYLSISTDIKDSLGSILGKMVTLYAHIDLDLDASDNIDLDGKFVKQGDLISENLYSGTMGGPHLHFEIRYYRKTDTGLEDFYGGPLGANTSPSTGSWSYGYWNPTVGYGFANPLNHISTTNTGIADNEINRNIIVFPNPVVDKATINFDGDTNIHLLIIYNLQGKEIERFEIDGDHLYTLDMHGYPSGPYLVCLTSNHHISTIHIIKE